jgi:small-conductance mechanosensitive channel
MKFGPIQLQSPQPSGLERAPALPAPLEEIAEAVDQATGAWSQEIIFFNITWLDGLLFWGVLVAAGLLDGLIRLVIWLRMRRWNGDVVRGDPVVRDGGEAPSQAADDVFRGERETRLWLDIVLAVSRGPFSWVIWVYAVYFGSFFLLRQMRLEQPDHVLFRGLEWLASLWGFIVLFWLIARIAKVVDERLRRRARRSDSRPERVLLPVAGQAARLIAPLIVVFSALPLLAINPAVTAVLRTVASIGLILAVALVLVRIIMALETAILAEFRIDAVDNLNARKIYTRVSVLRKMALAILGVVALACILMVFEPIRQVGASMLASAGIAGVVLGFAAQRSLSTLVAGIQIAMTQPIRLDDVVIVEGEWGRIEEITLTYVVVRIWDLRRLVVPINYFIETPFQNWTRQSADLLGAVFIYVDYSVPLDQIRGEVDRILENNPRWDGKVKAVQVTDATERTIEVRILASAPNAGTAFDLRCEVREKLIGFIQRQFPQALPRFRAEMTASAGSQERKGDGGVVPA